jgi:protein-S-isoprenylcysteine O-methyltransferase
MAAFRDVQVAQPARQVRAVVRRGRGMRGAMLTTLLAWLLLAGFVVLQRALRRGEQARSLRASAADRGSTRLLGAAFLVGALALVAAPALNALGIGAVGHGPVVGWIGIAAMVSGLALRLWSQAALGRYYTTTLRHAEGQPILASGPYRLVRHPGYAGLLLAWAGAGMATANWAVAAAIALVMAVAYGYRIAAEEAMLRGAFGDRYKEYMARTWRLIPYLY